MRRYTAGVLLLAACASRGHVDSKMGATACAAVVTRERATFVFPATPGNEWPINQPITEQFQSTVEYAWSVSWPAPGASTLDRRELNVYVRRDSIPKPAVLSLQRLIQRGSREAVNEQSREVGDGGITVFADSVFQAHVDGHRVVFTLTGQAAVQRYTAWRPDTATFEFGRRSRTEMECRVPIRYTSAP